MAIAKDLKVTLIDSTKALEKTLATAYKTCYSPSDASEIHKDMTKEKGEKFVKRILKQTNGKHISPLEHSYFTFAVDGVSRITAQQLTRHRIASFSMQSQRYVDMGDFGYKIPPEIEKKDHLMLRYANDMNKINRMYLNYTIDLMIEYIQEYGFKKMHDEKYDKIYNVIRMLIDSLKQEDYLVSLKELNHIISEFLDDEKEIKELKTFVSKSHKKAIENARYILPGGATSTLMYSANASSLLHFLSLRDCKRAQEEIRNIAHDILDVLKQETPLLYSQAGAGCRFGKCPEGNMTCGNPYPKKEIVKIKI